MATTSRSADPVIFPSSQTLSQDSSSPSSILGNQLKLAGMDGPQDFRTRQGLEPLWLDFPLDGTVAASVTKEATIKLEKARMTHLGMQITISLGMKEYERWEWEAWTKVSLAFLLSPLDHFGYMVDPHYQTAMAMYLGQPCPVMAPVVGRYFGKQGTRLDKYGANLAAWHCY